MTTMLLNGTLTIPGATVTGLVNIGGQWVINGVLCDVAGQVNIAVSAPPTLPPRNNLPIIPKMTGQTTGGFTAFSTTAYDGIALAWKSRSENPVTNQWQNLASSQAQVVSSGAPHEHGFLFDGPHAVYSVTRTPRSDTGALSPLTWVVEVYDGVQWIVDGPISYSGWTAGTPKTHDLQTPGIYYGVRDRVTSSGALSQYADWQANS